MITFTALSHYLVWNRAKLHGLIEEAGVRLRKGPNGLYRPLRRAEVKRILAQYYYRRGISYRK